MNGVLCHRYAAAAAVIIVAAAGGGGCQSKPRNRALLKSVRCVRACAAVVCNDNNVLFTLLCYRIDLIIICFFKLLLFTM